MYFRAKFRNGKCMTAFQSYDFLQWERNREMERFAEKSAGNVAFLLKFSIVKYGKLL